MRIPIKHNSLMNRNLVTNNWYKKGVGIATSHLMDIQSIDALISKVNGFIQIQKKLRY